jgi:DNA-binding MurR/RpiR family transcriptional regulator
MLKGGLISLREALPSIRPTERKAAQFIIDHPEQVVNLSVQKVAELAQVSEATLVRLSRSLHFKGFRELKLRLAADLAAGKTTAADSYQEIKLDGTASEFMQTISHNNIRSIQDTLTVLAGDSVEKAIDVLSKARKIVIIGAGASAVIAEDFKQKLSRIDLWCETALGFDAQATLAANMTEADAAFGVSYSGQTEDTIRTLSIAKDNGVTVISLTRFGSNPVSDLADIKLFTSSLEQSIRSGAMASRIAQLNVIDILYVGIASRNYERNIRALDKTRQAVRIAKRNGNG